MILTEQQVKQYLYNAGFRGKDLITAVKIAKCESGFNTNAHKKDAIEDSRGLMQINVKENANPQYAHLNLFDPQINANVAYEIYTKWGKNFNAWTCYKKVKDKNKGISEHLIFFIFLIVIIYLISYV